MTRKNTLALLENDFVKLEICQKGNDFTYFLTDKQNNVCMADMDYYYSITLWDGMKYESLSMREVTQEGNTITVKGKFKDCGIFFEQLFEIKANDCWLYEKLTLKNKSKGKIVLKDISFGMRKMLFKQYEGWCDNLDEYVVISVPTRRFRSQRVDRLKYYYTANDLVYAPWSSDDKSAGVKPGYFAEAWIWSGKNGGLIACKYNNSQIEYTRLERQGLQLPGRGCENVAVVYGGTAIFDGNPEKGLVYEPGFEYSFGDTKYTTFKGGFEEGYYAYREHLDCLGHTFPDNYNPPVHWNELYNLGWFAETIGDGHFSDNPNIELYTLEQLYEEARIAKEAGAESLYLDPGWDIYPGSCVWDEKRLGKFKDFVDKIHNEYGLKVALHLMMTFTSPDEIKEFYCRNADGSVEYGGLYLYRVCTNEVWVHEKTARLLKLVDDGVDFFMFDFPDYGNNSGQGCMDPTHGHEVPMLKQTHAENIMRVITNVKKRNPNVLIEAHDRIVGGLTEYHQLYFQHGGEHTFDENWGYEFMWNPMSDLISEKALSLYEYNMAYNIPLYLHINIHSDNDNLLSLWWYISTVRHLGIGGLLQGDPKYEKLKKAMNLYHSLKEYFTRGEFYGFDPYTHIHVKKSDGTAVINLYNLTSREVERSVEIDRARYDISACSVKAYDGIGEELPVEVIAERDKLMIKVSVRSLAVAVVSLK